VHPIQQMPSPVRVSFEQAVPDGLQLEQDLPEPQLVGLVDDDEEKLVMSGRVG